MEKHASGAPILHATFDMSSPAKRSMKAAAEKRKARRSGEETEEGSSEEESESDLPLSPADGTRRAKAARKKARAEAKAESKAKAKTATQENDRAARHAKRNINAAGL